MLMGDKPTHPAYLAMMQCIDARRDEKQRIIDLEFKFNMQTLKRWAVARRGQIHGQYFQSVREARETVLEDLGNQWYQVQQQRRRHANTIPDYGIRYPASKVQRTKDAVAFNKEVSILSGLAKYEGFPAAPRINGATAAEIDDDFEEIAVRMSSPVSRSSREGILLRRRPSQRVRQASQQASLPPAFASSLSFSLGVAGQQYLADTPWANPNHPSHHISRQQLQQESRTMSPLPGSSNRKQPQQAAPVFSSSTNPTIAAGHTVNGDVPLSKLQLTGRQESARASPPR